MSEREGPVEPPQAAPPGAGSDQPPAGNAIREPDKMFRIGSMARALLDEVRRAPLDPASRTRLSAIYDRSVHELMELLPDELCEELKEFSLPLGEGVPSEAELRVAHAQLIGWLEGLFHGIQATLVAQQMENQARLADMRGRRLPSPEEGTTTAGTYL